MLQAGEPENDMFCYISLKLGVMEKLIDSIKPVDG